MAYLDLSHEYSWAVTFPIETPQDILSAQDVLSVQDGPAGFERTEWTVIALARQDSLATLNGPRQSKLGRLLFGQSRRYALTGERLEALRRLAVEAWHRPLAISLQALGAFIAAGFTSAQLGLLLSATGALPAMAGLIPASPDAPSPFVVPRNSA